MTSFYDILFITAFTILYRRVINTSSIVLSKVERITAIKGSFCSVTAQELSLSLV